MTCIVDGRGPVAEDQAGRREHKLAGSDERERNAHPLPTPCSRRMDTSQHRRGDVRHRFRNTNPENTVEPADVGPPITARQTASEVGVGCAGLDG